MVSIGMPVFNDKKFLVKSIESLLNQSYKNFELIISDDCSTDESTAICEGYAKSDNRIKLFRQSKNLGISRNMEFLLAHATGEYFMWAADDDIWHPDYIKTLLKAFSKNPKGIVAFCPYSFIDENDHKIDNLPTRSINYASKWPFKRLLKLIIRWDDGFGYGLFVRQEIKDVKFPEWWGINKASAINNIYPSLFYYLSKGNYVHVEGNALWFNRIKPMGMTNHTIMFSDRFVRGFGAFALRKFNLYFKCNESILKANYLNLYLILLLFPFFLTKYLVDLFLEFESSLRLFIKGRKRFY